MVTLFQKKTMHIDICYLFLTGEILSIVGTVCNSSSKETKAKFSLQKRVVFTAYASHNTSDQSLCKMVGNTIKENSKEPISCQMKIPDDVIPTLRNCEIISVEYYLKVRIIMMLKHFNESTTANKIQSTVLKMYSTDNSSVYLSNNDFIIVA